MAKAGVQVVGDAASAAAAFEATSRGAIRMGDQIEAVSKKIVAGQARTIASIRESIAAYEAQAAAAEMGSDEQVAALAKVGQAQARLATIVKQTTYVQDIQSASAKRAADSQIKAAETIGRSLSTHVTLPATIAGAAAVKMSADFQQQMLMIQTQAGASAEEVHNLTNEVLALAQSGAVGPVQLAEGLYHLESVGLRGAEAMQVLKVSADAAFMGIADIETVTSALGAAVASNIQGAQDYEKAMGTLDATIGAGNMRMEDLAGALGNVLAPAKNAGVTLPEVGAAMAVLTDRGMGADEAATRLRMTLSMMQAPSQKAQEALGDLGINGDELAKMLRQPNGLLSVLELLHDRVQQVGQVRGSADLLRAFGGGRSGAGLLTLVQSLDSAVSSYGDKLSQISQQSDSFSAKVIASHHTTAYKIHQDWASAQADLIKFGNALAPLAVGVANVLSKVADAFNALPGPIKADIGVVVGVLAVGGPLLLAISGAARAVQSIGAAFSTSAVEATAAAGVIEADNAAIAASAERAAAAQGAAGAARGGMLAGLGAFALPLLAIPAGQELSNIFDAKGAAGGHFSNLQELIAAAQSGGVKGSLATGLLNKLVEAAHSGDPTAQALLGSVNPAVNPSAAGPVQPAPSIGANSTAGRGVPPKVGKLTRAQQLQIALAANPNDITLLKEKADLDQSTIEWLKRRYAAGKITNADYVKQITLIYQDQQQSLSQIESVKKAAAKKAAEHRHVSVPGLVSGSGTGSPFVLLPGTVSGAGSTRKPFSLPAALQVAMARAQALGGDGAVAKVAAEDKAYAEKLLAANRLTWQGKIDAYNLIAQSDQLLGGKTTKSHAKVISAAALATRLGLTGAAKKSGEEIIAQVLAHAGHVPSGVGAQGFGVGSTKLELHTHVKLNEHEIAHAVTKTQTLQRQNTAVQASGPHAGRQIS